MPREPDGYRDALEAINTMFPGPLLLNYEQVMQATGWKCIKTVKKRLPVVNEQVSKVALAKYMCGGNK